MIPHDSTLPAKGMSKQTDSQELDRGYRMAPFRPTVRRCVALAGVIGIVLAQRPSAASLAPIPGDERSVAHVLNRLAFGARPGDVDRMTTSGVASWIDAQLQPQRIADDAVDRRLAGLTTLTLDAETIAREYVAPARRERRL